MPHDFEDLLPTRLIQNRMRKRDREQLIWPARRIVASFAVDYVIQIPARLIPEPAIERVTHPVGAVCQTLCGSVAVFGTNPAFEQPERVVEERVDLDRFASPWRDDPVADLRIHPCQLIPLLAFAKQTIVGIHANAETVTEHKVVDD